jgi:hypothetical protein
MCFCEKLNVLLKCTHQHSKQVGNNRRKKAEGWKSLRTNLTSGCGKQSRQPNKLIFPTIKLIEWPQPKANEAITIQTTTISNRMKVFAGRPLNIKNTSARRKQQQTDTGEDIK